jgi:hypothetical protein
MQTKWPKSVRFTADTSGVDLPPDAVIHSFAAVVGTPHARRLAAMFCDSTPVHAYEFLDAVVHSCTECDADQMRGKAWVQYEWRRRMEADPLSIAWSMADGLTAEAELSLSNAGIWSLEVVALRGAVPEIIRRLDRRIKQWTAQFPGLGWMTTIGPNSLEKLISDVPFLALPA